MSVKKLRTSSVALALAATLGAGCGSRAAGTGAANAGVARDTRLSHEPCDVLAAGAERLDANGDKRPDVTLVRVGARESCRSLDLNFDGSVDVWVYFDGAGAVRRRESDYDRDGKIDEIALYQHGVLTEKQQATAPIGRVDTWRYYTNGKLKRAERDSNGDAIVDEWWEYPKPSCALVHADINGDGRPDPGATINQCAVAAADGAEAADTPVATPAPAAIPPMTAAPAAKPPASPKAPPTTLQLAPKSEKPKSEKPKSEKPKSEPVPKNAQPKGEPAPKSEPRPSPAKTGSTAGAKQ